MTHLKVIVVIVVALLVVILAVQNDTALTNTITFRIDPVFTSERISPNVTIYQVVIITFLFGVLSTGIYGMFERFRLKRQIKMLQGQLEDTNKELNSLRNLPITSEDVTAGEGLTVSDNNST